MKYWQQHPPLHLLVAAFLGHEPRKPSRRLTAAEEQENSEMLMASLPPLPDHLKLDIPNPYGKLPADVVIPAPAPQS